MRIHIGSDTEGPFTALTEDGRVLAVVRAADPLEALDGALRHAGRNLVEASAIAVNEGPGGFSEVRRRVSAANGLAAAMKIGIATVAAVPTAQVAAMPDQAFVEHAAAPVYAGAPNITKSKKASPLRHDAPSRALTYATLDEKGRRLYRIFELVPASLVWITILGAIALSFVQPIWMIMFIIAFDLYWFFRVLYFVIFLTASWRRHRQALDVDWLAELEKRDDWKKLVHLVFLPTYKEDLATIRATLQALVDARYPSERMIVVLGGEERAGREAFLEKAETVRKEFGHRFMRFIVNVHPDGIEGEMKSKGANMGSMAVPAKAAVDELGIPYDDVVVTAFDVDTIAHPQYFAYLSKTYLETPDRTRCSYQPVVLYSNNIWDANPVVRISAFGTTFWLLSELVRPERLFTFSSHSLPFRALIDVGFWQKDLVSEDSRIFLQCFIRYCGDYRVVPMYVPVSMDAVMAEGTFSSVANLYRQQRRWAWGVEHFPYLAVNFLRNPCVPLRKKLSTMWLLTEGMYTWATAPILMFVLGWLPLFIARIGERGEAVFQNAPHTLEIIMTFAMLGVLASAVLSLPLLPTRPRTTSRWQNPVMLLQWLLLPFTFVLFGAIPAIEAQTRLALGKKFHLGFWVTPKMKKDA